MKGDTRRYLKIKDKISIRTKLRELNDSVK